MLTDVETF